MKKRLGGSRPGSPSGGEIQHTTSLVTNPVENFFAPLVSERDELPEILEVTTHYHIEHEIAKGGMGVVYAARDIQLDRRVAIKMLREKFRKRQTLVRRFMEEARITSSLLHPGIAPVYEFGSFTDGRPFYAMKFVDGKTLAALLSEAKSNEQRAHALNIFAQVCQAMAYTHSRGVVHLDLKPANIMVGAFGEVHVMDWGLSRFLDAHDDAINNGDALSASIADAEEMAGDSISSGNDSSIAPEDLIVPGRPSGGRVAGSNQVRGTLEYMSPEQARGKALDKRTDVFGLGAMLSEILTGAAPYQGKTRKEVYHKSFKCLLQETFSALDSCGFDDSVIRLAKRCLSKSPDDRPDDAQAIASELTNYYDSALQVIETDMSRFFELSLDLFCIAGFDGFFRRINSNFSQILGYSDKELLATSFMEFIHEDDREDTVKEMGQLYDGKPVVRFRNRYRKADGDYITLEWTAKSLPHEKIIFAVARNVSH